MGKRSYISGRDGWAEMLSIYFGLDAVRLPENLSTIVEKIDYINDNTDIVIAPVTLTGQWYRDSAGPLLAMGPDGDIHLLLPDWSGKYYFIDRSTQRKIYVSGKNCDIFLRDGYSAAFSHSHAVSIPGMAKSLAASTNGCERFTLLLLCLAMSCWAALLGRLLYQMAADVILAADVAAFWRIAAAFAVMSLAGLLFFVCFMRLVLRISQRYAAGALPAAAKGIYNPGAAPKKQTAELAFALAGQRKNMQDAAGWMICAVSAAAVIIMLLPYVAFLSRAAVLVQSLFAAAVYAAAWALFIASSGGEPEQHEYELSCYQWSSLCAANKYLGMKRPFPRRKMGGRLQPMAFLLSGPVLALLPVIFTALGGGAAAAQFMRLLPVSLLMICPPLLLMASASSAGMAMCGSRFLLNSISAKGQMGGKLPPLGSALELRNVTFCYPKANAPVLCGVDLRVEAGETVGIYGATGSGKSTLIKLITGAEKPSSGSIYYGGIDLRYCNLRSVMRRIACEQGEDICIFEQTPIVLKGNSRIIFSSREQELASCDRILHLSNGKLV